ncbi:MAG TPA: hypothetical protein VEQ60_07265 [Longimicrobium sp.]|nr:hypothetical protein [Longimicrobium sp.]
MRSKLRLKLDDLSVDSFKMSPSAAKKGTVFACDATEAYTCDDLSCDDNCNTHNPCPTVLYTNCRGYLCA